MYIAIIKTAKDQPLWKGLPDDYPVGCAEFDTYELAIAAHPDAKIMTIAEYKEYASYFHQLHPAPHTPELRSKAVSVVKRKRWWEYLFFWRRN